MVDSIRTGRLEAEGRARSADGDDKAARLHHPIPVLGRPEGECARREREAHCLRFAGPEVDLAEPFQFARRPLYARLFVLNIELDNFLRLDLPDVADIHPDGQGIRIPHLRPVEAEVRVLEFGVGEAVPEGEKRLHAGRVVVAVADEYAFAVFDLFRVAGELRKEGLSSSCGKGLASLPEGLERPKRISATAPPQAWPPR